MDEGDPLVNETKNKSTLWAWVGVVVAVTTLILLVLCLFTAQTGYIVEYSLKGPVEVSPPSSNNATRISSPSADIAQGWRNTLVAAASTLFIFSIVGIVFLWRAHKRSFLQLDSQIQHFEGDGGWAHYILWIISLVFHTLYVFNALFFASLDPANAVLQCTSWIAVFCAGYLLAHERLMGKSSIGAFLAFLWCGVAWAAWLGTGILNFGVAQNESLVGPVVFTNNLPTVSIWAVELWFRAQCAYRFLCCSWTLYQLLQSAAHATVFISEDGEALLDHDFKIDSYGLEVLAPFCGSALDEEEHRAMLARWISATDVRHAVVCFVIVAAVTLCAQLPQVANLGLSIMNALQVIMSLALIPLCAFLALRLDRETLSAKWQHGDRMLIVAVITMAVVALAYEVIATVVWSFALDNTSWWQEPPFDAERAQLALSWTSILDHTARIVTLPLCVYVRLKCNFRFQVGPVATLVQNCCAWLSVFTACRILAFVAVEENVTPQNAVLVHFPWGVVVVFEMLLPVTTIFYVTLALIFLRLYLQPPAPEPALISPPVSLNFQLLSQQQHVNDNNNIQIPL